MSMEETETSRQLNTICEHLTKALSSGGSHVQLFNAYDELRTIESGQSHRLIAEEEFFPRLLISLLDRENTYLFRRWAGILVARFCYKSTAVANLLPNLAKRHGTHPLTYGIGNLILEEGGREDLWLICGLIIRSCVHHGVDHRIFWPNHKAPASFPIDDGREWADRFYQFTRAFDELDLDDSKGYSLSSVKGLPEFTTRGLPLQRLIEVPNGIAVVALYFDISHVQLLDIPFSQLLNHYQESLQIKLDFKDTTHLSVNATISKTRRLALRFADSGIASAALRAINKASAKAARSSQRFSTTDVLDLSFPPSTPDHHSQRLQRYSFADTLDASLLPSSPDYNSRPMSGATGALARRRAGGQNNSGSSSSLDPSVEKIISAKSATQPNPSKPDQVLVPDSLPTGMAEAAEHTTPNDEIIVPDSFPKSRGLSAAASSHNTTTRGSQNQNSNGREVSNLGSDEAESRTPKMGPENRRATQTTGVKKLSGKAGDVKENGTTTRRPPAVDKKRKIDGRISEKQKAYSKDAFDDALFDIPGDEDDGATETSTSEIPPKKRDRGSRNSKAATTRSTKKSKAPTQRERQESDRQRDDDSSEESDGTDDSSGDYIPGTSRRGRDTQRKRSKRSLSLKRHAARKEASRKRGPSKLREQLSQPKSQEQVAEGGSEVHRVDDVEPENNDIPDEEEHTAPLKDRRSESDVEMQWNEAPADEYDKDSNGVVNLEEVDYLNAQTEQTTSAESDPGADPGKTKAAEESEEQPETRTCQPDETSHEPVDKPPHNRTSKSNAALSPKTLGHSSQPDPNKSFFSRRSASGKSSQPDPSSSVSTDRRSQNIDAVNEERGMEETPEIRGDDGMKTMAIDERGIEEVQQTHKNTEEAIANEARGIEGVQATHRNSTEETLFDEHRHRKPQVIEFEPTGPRNQGKTPPGLKVTPKDHQSPRQFAATQLKTPSNMMLHTPNKQKAVKRGPTTYGSGPSRVIQEHPDFAELNQSSDERDPSRKKKKSLGNSPTRTIESPDVEPVVDNIARRAMPSKDNGEMELGDELAQLPPTEIGPSVWHKSGNTQGVQNPADEIGMDIETGQEMLSENEDNEDFADGLAPPPQTDIQPSQRINHSFVDTKVEDRARQYPGLESCGESQSAYQSTFVPSESRPSSRNLDGNPASEAVFSPVVAILPGFVPTPSATDRTKRRREGPAEDHVNLPNQNLFLGPPEIAQPAPHDAETRRRPDISGNPHKRARVYNQLSSPHEEFSTRLSKLKKADATNPSVALLKKAAPLQGQTSTKINDYGSPEPFDDPQGSKSNIAGGSGAKLQAQLYRSPALNRAGNVFSPSSARVLMSSNRKKLPDPPLASSKAITTHAPEHMLKQSKLLNTPARPGADPFSSREIPKNGESKFAAMLRQKSEAQGLESAEGKQDCKTPGLEALINARYEEDEDPDRTLVNDENMGDLPDYDSDMSNASTLDEDEEEDDGLHLKNHHPDEVDWETCLKPHQQDYAAALSRISERLVRHLVDQEVAIEDIVAAFEHDGNNLIEAMERAHQEEFELERETVNKARAELKSMLERMGGNLRNDVQLFDARRQKLRHEARTSVSASRGLKGQISVLEGMLTKLQ